jgi:Flp pilus assembly protein TadG
MKKTDRGAAAVEFAFVSLLLMFFIYAIAAFGLMLSTKNSLTHAAAEGARSAIAVADQPTATADARRITAATTSVARTLDYLGAKYQPSDTTASIAGCDSPADTHKCITVVVTYPWSSRPLIPMAPGLGLAQPDTLRATAVVRLT